MTLTTIEKDYVNLKPEQKEYFERLADGCDCCDPIDYFEKVPAEIRDSPELVEVYLDGGTVTKEVWVEDRGRAGGHYEEVEFEVGDRDWSHDVSRANGGSDCADNGRFEDSSTNRSRGATNTTEAEKRAADTASERDAEILDESTVIEEAEEAATLTVMAEGSSIAADLMEFSLDLVAPTVAAIAAGKIAYDKSGIKDERLRMAFTATTSVATYAVIASPIGAPLLGGYLGYKLFKRGRKFFANR